MAETLVRIQHGPPAAVELHNQNPYGASFITSKEQTTTTAAFQPIDGHVLAEIFGYVSLGLSDNATVPAFEIPWLVYKWHTFASRMNQFLADRKNQVVQYLAQPPPQIPADLYFLSNTSPSQRLNQLVNASTAPLGPLLPSDSNTLLNALQKGLQKCALNNDPGTSPRMQQLIAYMQQLCKLAFYAVEPRRQQQYAVVKSSQIDVGRDASLEQFGGIENLEQSDSLEHFADSDDLQDYQDYQDYDLDALADDGLADDGLADNGLADNGLADNGLAKKCGMNWIRKVPWWLWAFLIVSMVFIITTGSESGPDNQPEISSALPPPMIGGTPSNILKGGYKSIIPRSTLLNLQNIR